LQRARDLGGAEAAVGFAEQIFGRVAAAVVGEPGHDGLRHRIGVALYAPERAAAVGLDGAAVARADRIDQHEIGEGEPGVRIVVQPRGRRVAAVDAELGNARPDQAEVQVGGRRARPAVEGEGHRPARAGILGDIGNVEDRRSALARRVMKRQRARGGGVGDRPIRRVDAVMGDGVGRQQSQRALLGDLVELDERDRRDGKLCGRLAVLILGKRGGRGRANQQCEQAAAEPGEGCH
jgi:hypothetical protein